MTGNYLAKAWLAFCACLLSVGGTGGLRTFAGTDGTTGAPANQTPPNDPWQQELKERQSELRSKAYNFMQMAPSRIFRRLTWATPSVVRNSLKRRPAGLDRRLMESEARRREIAAHAVKIALLGILDPDQAEMVKRMAWKSDGLEALRYDDELAARLRLDRVQRQEIALRLAALAQAQVPQVPIPIAPAKGTSFGPASEIYVREMHDRVQAASKAVWEVLDESQIERWERLMEPLAKMEANHHHDQ